MDRRLNARDAARRRAMLCMVALSLAHGGLLPAQAQGFKDWLKKDRDARERFDSGRERKQEPPAAAPKKEPVPPQPPAQGESEPKSPSPSEPTPPAAVPEPSPAKTPETAPPPQPVAPAPPATLPEPSPAEMPKTPPPEPPAAPSPPATPSPRQTEQEPRQPAAGQPAPRAVETVSGPVQWAVLIGVADYIDRPIPDLRYPEKDVAGLRSALIEENGYTEEHVLVLTGKGATAERVRRTLDTVLAHSVSGRDSVLIFFSGRGATARTPRRDVSGREGYLLLYDTKLHDLYGTALSVSELARMLGRIPAATRLLLADTDFAGGARGKGLTRGPGNATQPDEKYVGLLARAPGTAVILASHAGEMAFESKKYGHGLFSYCLIEALSGAADNDGDSAISIGELYGYLAEHIPAAAETSGIAQHPLFRGQIGASAAMARLTDSAARNTER